MAANRKYIFQNSEFAELYDLKEDFFDIYDENKTSKENAKKAFTDWEKSIPEILC
ncbi:MAG: transposase [Anaerolineaceae bacterium]|nr:transposase [Anaerolineaceae bacterium]